MRVEWLRQALRNLDEDAAFIAQDAAAAAARVVRRTLDRVAQLEEHPGLGQPGRAPSTRELVVTRTRYLVPYRVRGDFVEVLRVFQPSRRLPATW